MPTTWPTINTATLEAGAVTALSSIPALGALYPAAYFSYIHATQVLAVDDISAKIMAGAIELLGYVIVDAAIRSLEKRRGWLVVLSVVAFAGYLLAIVSLNVSLSIAQVIGADVTKWAVVFAVAVLVLLSIPASLWGAVMSQLRQIDARAAILKAEQIRAVVDARSDAREVREFEAGVEREKRAEIAQERREARALRTQSTVKQAIAKQVAEFVCSCGFEAKSQKALNGHKLKHKPPTQAREQEA